MAERRGWAALSLAALAALAGCGDGTDSASKAKPVGEKLVGSVAPMATCGDWRKGSRAERVATIHDIRQQVNLKDSQVNARPLSDPAAYRILDNTCRRPYVGSVRLYKLYARADSFAPLASD